METYEEILSRMREAYEAESGHAPEDVSDTGLRLRVLAGELYRLRAELGWLRRQAFPQTATGEWLDRHGAQRGLTRKEAERSGGAVTFSRYLPLSFDAVIPAGTVCAVPGEEPLEFETTEDGVLPAGELSVTVAARAVEGGRAGNVSAGYVNTMTEPSTLVNHLTNSAPFTGGRDREDDDSYRARVLAAYAAPANGSNAAYYRDVALAFPGVGAAGVIPRESGAGTVGVYIWGEGEAPAEETVAGLQEEFAARREIGVTVSVSAAEEREVNVTARLELRPGADFSKASEAVTRAVAGYFSGLTVGSPMYLAELERVILNAAPIVKLEFPASMSDVSARADRIPTLGTVTVEALE